MTRAAKEMNPKGTRTKKERLIKNGGGGRRRKMEEAEKKINEFSDEMHISKYNQDHTFHECYVNYLLMFNQLPPKFRNFEQHIFIISFSVGQISRVQLSWVSVQSLSQGCNQNVGCGELHPI